MTENKYFDVIIIGGSYAGLSAAMTLGRSTRKVLVIDSGLPCNRQTPHSHNFITQDGKKPKEIAVVAKQQVEKYDTVEFCEDVAIKGQKNGNLFEISTLSGKTFTAKKLVFATGIKDIIPAIKGFEACWGISVIHCPYCHGYEFRQQKTAIMANGAKAAHYVSLIYNLSANLTLLTSGKADFTEEQVEKIKAHQIEIIEKEVQEIVHQNGKVQEVVFKDNSAIKFDAIYAAVPFIQHSDIPETLGCELTEQGFIKVDTFQQTNTKGVYACGDNSSPMRSVANAVASGNFTGAAINKALSDELFW
ncbi:NAD(P)/FAD-dependent oxidoreductase [Pedobacter montanisoli]|uniref:NAD(P)/FAD-dependent oxidoreductase n=1 Tax=Pedobacter montanisoli TaxID=2923277 RepID=A0ABS9ZW61_9SPHI|nr:NAD(P)/FAD-dependent oxidoreductase [Pedobacter montanisoli]MCJ0742548.1 NAD(P)/FAD-dependent oxidoreductase [Pedobacter montanisoli]